MGSDEGSQMRMEASLATMRYIVKTKLDALEEIFDSVKLLKAESEEDS